MRYSLRTLLILMLLVGPLCIWGWPAYENWRDERARVAKVERVTKRLQQSIAFLDQQRRLLGGASAPALAGTESIDELQHIELRLMIDVQLAQMMKATQQAQLARPRRLKTQLLLHFEGSAQELR